VVSQKQKQKQVVLIVEDEALIRMHAADMICDLGFEVIEAADADQAISLLESNPNVSVVFTDIQMPGSMDGLRLVAAIRKRWPPVALLVTSGQLRPKDNELPENAHFLPKPYMMGELKTHLDALTH
jgi:two-component system, response regulator PdtaR